MDSAWSGLHAMVRTWDETTVQTGEMKWLTEYFHQLLIGSIIEPFDSLFDQFMCCTLVSLGPGPARIRLRVCVLFARGGLQRSLGFRDVKSGRDSAVIR